MAALLLTWPPGRLKSSIPSLSKWTMIIILGELMIMYLLNTVLSGKTGFILIDPNLISSVKELTPLKE